MWFLTDDKSVNINNSDGYLVPEPELAGQNLSNISSTLSTVELSVGAAQASRARIEHMGDHIKDWIFYCRG